MSYEYKGVFIESISNFIYPGKIFDDSLSELDHVYAQAAKADEYEAKAIILDRVKAFATEPPFLLANNEHEDYELYAYDQILRLIEKYESGGYDAKNDEVDYCAKCTVKPIVKEHMCEECYIEHNERLRNQPKGIRIGDYLAKDHKFSKEELEKAIDSDQWYTLYESKA